MRYNLGQTVELTFAITPDETPTLTVTAPDGTVSTPTITGSAGAYTALVDAGQAGTWAYVWSTPNGGDQVGSFKVGRPYASAQDVTDLFRLLTDVETVKATRLLEFASSIVRGRVSRLDERIAGGMLDPDLVAGVVTAMVVRVMRNPDGRRMQTETAGPFTESWTVDQALSSGALYVSDAELESLAPPAARLRVGTIRLRSWC